MTITGDWAEGDPLTPTNLSTKGGGNFPDRTYNAGWARFGSTSVAKEVRIQAAINAAAADGIPAVFIPASMLPYDTSAVTFNSNIHMMCEGGSVGTSEFDVRAYGGLDWQTTLSALHDLLPSGTGNRQIRFPPQQLGIARPWWISKSGLGLLGAYDGTNSTAPSSQLTTIGYVFGPAILCEGTSKTILTGPALVGSGVCYKSDVGHRSVCWFNLRDAKALDINGLSQICVEAWVNFDTLVDFSNIIQSTGVHLTSDAESTAFRLRSTGAGAKAEFTLKLSGGTVTLTDPGTSFIVGNTYHVRGNYDGSTVRLFVNGTMVASGAGSGTVVQAPPEDVFIGAAHSRAPERFVIALATTGRIDSPRISNVSRETTNFTPPSSKYTSDANTLITTDFSTIVGPLVQATNKDGTGWLYHRDARNLGGASIMIRDLCISDGSGAENTSGIFLGGFSTSWSIDRVSTFYMRNGIASFTGDNYNFMMRNVSATAHDGSSARYGVRLGGNTNIGQWDTGWIRGYSVGAAIVGATKLTNVFVNGSSNQIFGIHISPTGSTATTTIDTCFVSEEAGSSAITRGAVAIDGAGGGGPHIKISGCYIENGSQNQPFLIVDGSNGCEITSTDFHALSTPSQVVTHQGTALRRILVVASYQAGTWVPWCNVPGLVTIGVLGKGTAIAFATPLTLDCSLRDDFELGALTGAITINFSNVTPGQKISLWTVQNAGGGNAITFGTVNGTGAVKGATANDTTGNHYSQYLFDCNLNGNMSQLGFSSGA